MSSSVLCSHESWHHKSELQISPEYLQLTLELSPRPVCAFVLFYRVWVNPLITGYITAPVALAQNNSKQHFFILFYFFVSQIHSNLNYVDFFFRNTDLWICVYVICIHSCFTLIFVCANVITSIQAYLHGLTKPKLNTNDKHRLEVSWSVHNLRELSQAYFNAVKMQPIPSQLTMVIMSLVSKEGFSYFSCQYYPVIFTNMSAKHTICPL